MAWVKALEVTDITFEAVNLGSGVKSKVSELIEIIQQKTKVKELKLSDGTPGDQFGIYADVCKLRKMFKMKEPISLTAGLDNFITEARIELLKSAF